MQRFWYLLTQLGWKDRHLEVLAPHGVHSFRNLTAEKAEEVLDVLRHEWNENNKRPRGAVIHYLCIMPGYTFTRGSGPDYEKINAWVTGKMGKELNKLSMAELAQCVTMVKQWYRKELSNQTETYELASPQPARGAEPDKSKTQNHW